MLSVLLALFRAFFVAPVRALAGKGPPKETPEAALARQHVGFSPADIVWHNKNARPARHRLEYYDRHGEITERDVLLVSERGTHANGHEYVGAICDGKFKTFRRDRILKLQIIP
jgi:hypothetical protein